MDDQAKTREQLLEELMALRARVSPPAPSWVAGVLDAIADSLFVLDRDWRFVYLNGQALREAREPAHELLGRSLWEKYPALLGTPLEGHYRRATAEQTPAHFEMRGLLSGRWLEVHAYPSPDGLVAFSRDATEHKRAEEGLRRAEQKYRDIFESAQDGIFQSSPEGRYLSANPALARMYGYDSPEELTAEVDSIARQVYVDPGRRAEFIRQIDLRDRVEAFESQMRRKDGTVIWISENARAVRDARGRLLYYEGFQRDVTERKLLEEQARQSQKMEAVGQLAGGVAHDFNNLLTIIQGVSDVLLARLPVDDPTSALVAEIGQAGERAAALTRQLLAFGRKQVLEPKVLDLNAVVADMEKMLRRMIGEDVRLACVLGEGLRPVKADPGQLEQVLMNLAVNARDAMPTGGKLTIETADVALDETGAKAHPGLRAGRYAMVSVSDTGRGMDEATRARIFEPFFTTKGPGKGTGLGLATVYGIVQQSGGSVSASSEPGRGATFTIYLPAVDGAVPAKKAAPATMPRGTEAVLLVEDEAGVRALGVQVLRACGYTVWQACDGLEAIRFCEQHAGPIDLLVSDVVMPYMGGRQLAERLLALKPGMKVLYVSGYTDDAVVRHGVLQEQVNFLQKPFMPAALVKKVREVLDAEAPAR